MGFASKAATAPYWLETLLREKFFLPCMVHETSKKNEKNIFCLDCCITICPQCLIPHRSHRLLQIRRYVYHNVVRLDDLEKLIDCSLVQSYTTNSAKVVFLNQRQQSRPFRFSGNICSSCDRCLQDAYLFCSLSCKVKHLLRCEGGLAKYLYECKYLPLPENPKGESLSVDIDERQLSPDSVLDSPAPSPSASGSSSSGCGGGCRPVSEFARKRRSALSGSSSRPAVAFLPSCSDTVNRRKRVPSRSPLF
ncbi:hypothetical protein QJS10_CPA10g00856 [Acorus calamus]|uniref:B box-type domain-containing protein n=1 Tax=Acorus calamus TaxID=4465 RepID=A0AAV9E0Q0_ACOCL|nr:hypothetical protein QJS10_CPA10g00856 [Acorus calamus]